MLRVGQFGRMVAFAVVLSGCGGGGGDGGGADTSTPTGLVPTAPPPGATLFSDAAVFRPLRDTALWEYEGAQVRVGSEQLLKTYTNVVTHALNTDGSVVEAASNPDGTDTPVSQEVSLRSGEVHAKGPTDLGNGPTALDQLELRSPVRANDQYTVIDTRIDLGVDLDGDGLHEVADLAIYTRVVGAETVDIVNYPQIQTLHVTTTIASRVRASKTGDYGPVASGTIDVWYAAGVGIVKRQLDMPANVGGTPPGSIRTRTTETLVSWDGVTEGIGHMANRHLEAGSPTALVWSAVGFDTTALVASPISSGDGGTDLELIQVDWRGRTLHNVVRPFDGTATLIRVGNEARVIDYETGIFAQGIRMHSVDLAGNQTSPSFVILAPGETHQAKAAGAGDVFWVVWVQPAPRLATTGDTLQLQSFNAGGQPLTVPQILTDQDAKNLRIAGAPGHVLVTWDESTMDGSVARYAHGLGSSPAVVRTLTHQPMGQNYFGATPVATSSGAASVWANWYPAERAWHIAGVGFDAASEVLRSNETSLNEERLQMAWLDGTSTLHTASGAAVVDLVGGAARSVYPGGPKVAFGAVVEMTPSGGPLATSANLRLLSQSVPTPGVRAAVSLTDSVLLFHETVDGLSVTPVWRRK